MFFLPIIFFIINFKQILKPISKVFSNPLNFKTIVTCFVMIGWKHTYFNLTYFYCFLGRGKIQQQKDLILLGKCLIGK